MMMKTLRLIESFFIDLFLVSGKLNLDFHVELRAPLNGQTSGQARATAFIGSKCGKLRPESQRRHSGLTSRNASTWVLIHVL